MVELSIVNTIKYLTLLELPTDMPITEDIVHSQFRKLCLIYHPDQANNRYKDGEKFKEIKQAEEYLTHNIKAVNNQILLQFKDESVHSYHSQSQEKTHDDSYSYSNRYNSSSSQRQRTYSSSNTYRESDNYAQSNDNDTYKKYYHNQYSKDKINKNDYKVGQAVFHESFGKGIITSMEPRGGDCIMHIDFEEYGIKQFSYNFAFQFLKHVD